MLTPLVENLTLFTRYWNLPAAVTLGSVCAAMTCSVPLSMFEVGPWQVVHCESLATIFELWFAPVAKFTLSWQAPQASAVGTV